MVDAVLLAPGHDELIAHAPQVVARNPWKEMMFNLILQADVEPVEVRWTLHVHGGGELDVCPGLGVILEAPSAVLLHAKMGDGDLHVQQSRNAVGHQQEEHHVRPSWQETAEPREPRQKQDLCQKFDLGVYHAS